MNTLINQIVQLDTYFRAVEDPPRPAQVPDAAGRLRFELEPDAVLLINPLTGKANWSASGCTAAVCAKDPADALKDVWESLFKRAQAHSDRITKAHLDGIKQRAFDAVAAAGK